MRLGHYCLFLCTLNSIGTVLAKPVENQQSMARWAYVCVCVCLAVGRQTTAPATVSAAAAAAGTTAGLVEQGSPRTLSSHPIHPSIHLSSLLHVLLLMIHIQHGAWSMTRLQRSRVQHCRRRLLTLGMAVRSLFLQSFSSTLSLFFLFIFLSCSFHKAPFTLTVISIDAGRVVHIALSCVTSNSLLICDHKWT